MSFHRRRALLAFALTLATSCASPGDPTPRRSPIIPQAVQDLAVSQQGDHVVLRFTLPDQSVRNEPLLAPPAIEVYRGAVENERQAAEKVPTRLVYTIPGEMLSSYTENGQIIYRDRIDPQELARAASTISERVYVVRTRVERNRASAESNRVRLGFRPPPAPVAMVRARLVPSSTQPSSIAVLLEWPGHDNSIYYVHRAEVAPDGAIASPTSTSQVTIQTALVKIAEVRTSTSTNDSFAQYQDNTVELGRRYLYVIRSVVEFAGPSFVESADAPPTLITVAETVPPAAPLDLEAVVVPATGTEPAYVTLSWAISGDTTVAGYSVFRSQPGGRWANLNEDLLVSPTYRDVSVVAGQQYRYSVIAVSNTGAQSAPGVAVEVRVPGP
jgi:hypothetical protein